MQLDDRYSGANTPFEGDYTLYLRTLPAGATVTKAVVELTPVAAPAQEPDNQPRLFEEIIEFDNEDKGTIIGSDRRIATRIDNSIDFVAVNFHARRKLIGFRTNSNLDDATLQIDIGGSFVELNDRYTVKAPEEPALLLSNANHVVPGLLVQQFAVNQDSGNPTIHVVTIQSAPTNVSLRLGDMPPFWTQLGEITATTTSSDFAAILNAYLSTATPKNGFYTIPLVVHSDAIARLDIHIRITYTLSQRVLPPHLPEATLPFTFGTVPAASESLLKLSLPVGAVPRAATAQIQGEFKPTRIALGLVGPLPRTVAAEVSPDRSLAQPIWVDREISVTAIDLLFSKADANLAGMQVSIREDADGKPSERVLKTADVVVGKPVPPEQTSWGSATFSEPQRVSPAEGGMPRRYWLVLQSQVGKAEWQVETGTGPAPGLHHSVGQGAAWRVTTLIGEPQPLSALFRLRHQPEQFTVPIQLQIGRGPTAVRRRLDEFAPLGRVEFQFDFEEALAAHLSQAESVDSCGRETLLVNGDFSLPASDDATHKLFDLSDRENFFRDLDALEVAPLELGHYGFDTSTEITRRINRIDLSTERYLTLSTDEVPTRIDCAGDNPARTRLDEIVGAINAVFGENFARVLGSQEPEERNWRINTNSLTIHGWCSPTIPTGWQGIAGQILRVRWRRDIQVRRRDDNPRFALLFMHPSFWTEHEIDLTCFPPIPPEAETSTTALILSQQAVCREGCTYLFQFNYSFLTHEDLPVRGFLWQLVWQDQAGNPLRVDEGLVPHIPEPDPDPSGGENGGSESNELTFRFYEARVIAPTDAVTVDVRFEHQAPGGLILDSVALTPTAEALNNARFSLRHDDGELMGWQAIGNVDTMVTPITLAGEGSDPAILSQVIDVLPETDYQLEVNARFDDLLSADVQNLPITQRSRLELTWADASPAVVLLLDEPGFSHHIAQVRSPAAVSQAEIRIVQPFPEALQLTSVFLSKIDSLDVPLIFLSDAPGELVVSNMQVEYDPPANIPLLPPVATDQQPLSPSSIPRRGGRVAGRGASRVSNPSQPTVGSGSATLSPRSSRRVTTPVRSRTTDSRSAVFTPLMRSAAANLSSKNSTNGSTVALPPLQALPAGFAPFLADAADADRALLQQGFSFAAANRHTIAIAKYRQVIARTEGRRVAALARLLLGDLHHKLDEQAEAIEYYDAFIAAVPNVGYAYHQRGLAKAALDDRAGALEDLEQAAEIFQQLNQLQNYQKTLRQIRLLG